VRFRIPSGKKYFYKNSPYRPLCVAFFKYFIYQSTGILR
jgi:putative heme iron utilization protein